jgi:predicted dehydrogenase
MCLNFRRQQTAIIHSSWLDPRKVREMTLVGSRRMLVYDDVAPLEKIRIFDARVERPPHYDTFAEFHYAYHYGDVHVPYLKQEEPLKTECQHFLDCINQGTTPLTDGKQGLELVRILEASSKSLKRAGASVSLSDRENGNGCVRAIPEPASRISTAGIVRKKTSPQTSGKLPLRIQVVA